MSCVACHLSPVTNANSHSHRPSPCKLPPYAQYAGLQRQKNHKNGKKANKSRFIPILEIHSLTISLQSIGMQGFQTCTDRRTSQLIYGISLGANSVKAQNYKGVSTNIHKKHPVHWGCHVHWWHLVQWEQLVHWWWPWFPLVQCSVSSIGKKYSV